MNIFVLDKRPKVAARYHCNKHVVKMVLESAQMLSTAHRVLDGTPTRQPSKSGKTMVKYWEHPNRRLDDLLYKTVHVSHPCTVWTMESIDNYQWHYELFIELSKEFTRRYGKVHLCESKLAEALSYTPRRIPQIGLTPFKLAMGAAPECNDPSDPVGSYRKFYITKQDRFKLDWPENETPEWFEVKA